jgi:hypothetical protein
MKSKKVSVKREEFIFLKYLVLLRYIRDLQLIISQNKQSFPLTPTEYNYRLRGTDQIKYDNINNID